LAGGAVTSVWNGNCVSDPDGTKTGKVHRYYYCLIGAVRQAPRSSSTCNRHGKVACKGRSIQMDKLDGLVTKTVAEQLLQPERITAILALLANERAVKEAAVEDRLNRLEHVAQDAEQRLSRLYRMVERVWLNWMIC
jgi:hypothetical protein